MVEIGGAIVPRLNLDIKDAPDSWQKQCDRHEALLNNSLRLF